MTVQVFLVWGASGSLFWIFYHYVNKPIKNALKLGKLLVLEITTGLFNNYFHLNLVITMLGVLLSNYDIATCV